MQKQKKVPQRKCIVCQTRDAKKGLIRVVKNKENEIFKKLVKHFYENNKIIVAICTAVINLIETREIKNRKVTTYLLDNKRYFNQLKKFDIIPEEKEIIVDENLFTCSGPANALDLSLLILEKMTSKENVEIVKKNMFLK